MNVGIDCQQFRSTQPRKLNGENPGSAFICEASHVERAVATHLVELWGGLRLVPLRTVRRPEVQQDDPLACSTTSAAAKADGHTSVRTRSAMTRGAEGVRSVFAWRLNGRLAEHPSQCGHVTARDHPSARRLTVQSTPAAKVTAMRQRPTHDQALVTWLGRWPQLGRHSAQATTRHRDAGVDPVRPGVNASDSRRSGAFRGASDRLPWGVEFDGSDVAHGSKVFLRPMVGSRQPRMTAEIGGLTPKLPGIAIPGQPPCPSPGMPSPPSALSPAGP